MKFKYLLESKEDLISLLPKEQIHKIAKILSDGLFLDFNSSSIDEFAIKSLTQSKIKTDQVFVLHSPKSSFEYKGKTITIEPETWILFKDEGESGKLELFAKAIETHDDVSRMYMEQPKKLIDKAKIESWMCFVITAKSNYSQKNDRVQSRKIDDKMGSRIRDYLLDR